MKKRLLSILLTVCMVLTLLPTAALAAEGATAPAEQFTLATGQTYYFDLSGEAGTVTKGISSTMGTINAKVPDTTLHYVPFTYAGTVHAYSLDSTSSGNTGASAAATASDRSLFVAEYAVSHTNKWANLDKASLIFGKNFDTNYTLRSLSVGSSDGGGRGLPVTNEWDSILGKTGLTDPIKNHSVYSWGQDTDSENAANRAMRGNTASVVFWTSTAATFSENYFGWRPALEVDTTALTTDGLKAVTLNLNGGKLKDSATDINIVCAGATFKAPSGEGLTRPTGNNTAYFKWNTQADGNGINYEAGATMQNSVTMLYAQWNLPKAATPAATFAATGADSGTLSGLTADMKYQIGSGAWTEITSADDISLTSLSACTISVVKKGDGTTTSDSKPQTIAITQATAPTVGKTDETSALNDGTMTGVTAAMEYKKRTDSAYTPITGTTVTGLTAGIYDVRVKATGTVLASADTSVTIAAFAKKTPTIADLTYSLTAVDYSGSAISVSVTAASGKSLGAITVKYADSTTAPTNAGTYAITVDIAGNAEYNAVTALSLGNFTINKATNSIANLTLAGWTYGGTAGTPSATATFGTPTFSYDTAENGTYADAQPTDAGTYWVKASVAGTDNYDSAEQKTSFTIAKKPVTAPAIAAKAYTGTPLTADVTGTGDYDVTTNDGGTNVGNYNVVLTLKDANRKWSDSDVAAKTLTFTINKIAYTGNKAIAASVVESGKVGATVSIPALPDGASYGTPAASGTNTMTGMRISGTTLTYTAPSATTGQTGTMTIPVTGATNYTDYNVVVTVTYTAKTPQEISYATTNINKTYGDAEFTNALTQTTVKGAITYASDDAAVATVDAAGEVTIVAVGDGSATITATAAATDTHAKATASYTVTVAKKALTLQAENKSMTKGGAVPSFTYTATGLVNGDTVTIDPTMATVADGKTTGTFDITISGGTVANDANYSITYTTGTLTVSDAPITTHTITASASTGGTISPSGSVTVNNGESKTFAITPNSGYRISAVTVDGVNQGAISSHTFRNVTGNHSISATFSYNGGGGSSSGGGDDDHTPTLVTELKVGGILTGNNLDRLIAGGKDLTVTGAEGAKLVFDTDALRGINDQTSGGVQVEIKDVSAEHPDSHEGKTVFSLTVTSGGKTVSDFDGKVTISLPYTLKAGEKAEDVTVWHLADDGSMTEIPATYDPKTGLATATVSHFSQYVVGVWSNPFVDVQAGDWCYDAVKFVHKNGLFSGVNDTVFAPDASMNRAMLWMVLARQDGRDTSGGSPWYESGLSWAMETGISDGTKPMDKLTREQLITMLWRYAGSPVATGDLGAFTDGNTVANHAKQAMAWAVENGLVQGDGATLKPKQNATRAQVAAILMRYCENGAQ